MADFIEPHIVVVNDDGDVGDGGGAKSNSDKAAAPQDDASRRTVGVLKLAVIAYFLTCGGPFGIEDAVGSAGPAITLSAFIALPVVWALPQALMTAELATLMPVNGGSVLWIQRAFGDFAGWMNAWNNQIAALVDLALYPVLVDDYLATSIVGLPWIVRYGIKLGTVLFITACNLVGLDVVSWLSVVLLVLILAPFVALACVVPLGPVYFERLADLPAPGTANPALALSTLLWSFTGWDTLGAVAGEVKNPKTTYPRGVAIAVVAAMLNFAIPIICGYAIAPDAAKWTDGYFADVARIRFGWLGDCVVAASVISNLGQFNAQMAVASRAMWAMATGTGVGRKLPAVVATEWSRFRTPAAAIIIVAITTSVLILLPFQLLIQFEMILVCVTLNMEFTAFMWLKYKDTSPRPYAVPGGKFGAWLITIPKAVLVSANIILATWQAHAFGWSCQVLFILGYVLFRCTYHRSARVRKAYQATPIGSAGSSAAAADAADLARPQHGTRPAQGAWSGLLYAFFVGGGAIIRSADGPAGAADDAGDDAPLVR